MSYLFVRAIHLKISPHQEGKFFSNIHGFIYSHWVHTSAGEQWVPHDIRSPVVKCFGTDMIYYWNWELLNNVINMKNEGSPPLGIGNLGYTL